MPSRPTGYDLQGLLKAVGLRFDTVTAKATESPEEQALRLRKDFLSCLVKEIAAYAMALLFIFVMGGYCCYVVARHGTTSEDSKQVFPLRTSLFGAVIGIAFGKATK